MKHFPERLLAARADLAAADLRGQVAAERFAAGERRTVTASLADLTLRPDPASPRDTQLLHGETFVVYETRDDGLVWGQSVRDGYVGYVATSDLGPVRSAGSMVSAIWSQVYPAADLKLRPVLELPLGAIVGVAGTRGAFARLRSGGFVPRAHLEPGPQDFVTQAERFTGVPYLWGGRSARGLDCSALVQLAGLMVGIALPRDSDMLEAMAGAVLPGHARLRRGDLVFWRGHVGIMQDADTLLHANAHHMAVASEPLARAAARIEATGGGSITMRRRLGMDVTSKAR